MSTTSLSERIALFRQFLDKAQLDSKTYQVDGVEWCLKNELDGVEVTDGNIVRGGIIADEMGLGKTITMIGLCIANVMRKTLIVLPVILMEQWASQIYKTTGHRALIYHGASKKKINLAMLEKSVIVLTSYQTVAGFRGKTSLLHSVHWNRLVFDEAHHLRNFNTIIFQKCYSLKSQIRWLMTGTPIQNKAKDFYHLCAVLRIPVSVVDDIEYVKTHFMLKRTKADVGLSLPNVNYYVEEVDWTNPKEKGLAQSLHSQLGFCYMMDKAEGDGGNEGGNEKSRSDDIREIYQNCGSIVNAIAGQGKGHLLRFLSASKQSCVLPKLMAHSLDQFVANGPLKSYDREMIMPTSKLDVVCRSLIEKKDNHNGKLVFCYYHMEMETLYQRLTEGGMKVLIYGKKPKGSNSLGWKWLKNMNLNELDYDAIIIQIQTGCEGLNLQKYSEVYFVSPSWNPMLEEQAIARCHRIGQVKPVLVNHFIMNGFDSSSTSSLDKYILEKQLFKRGIIKDMIG